MTSLKDPVNTQQGGWGCLFDKWLTIPMNQRCYSWQEEEHEKFINDLFTMFEENKYKLHMGIFVMLEHNGKNEVYEGQQRLLTTVMILKVIGTLCPVLEDTINRLLVKDKILYEDRLTETEKKTASVGLRVPTVDCVNPHDRNAVIDIINNRYVHWSSYLSKDGSNYICNECNNFSTKREKQFIKHINDSHYNNGTCCKDRKSLLYSTYDYMYCTFVDKGVDEAYLIKLYQYIMNGIRLQVNVTDDPEYACRQFEWQNNRGRPLESLDVYKNSIMYEIPDDKKDFVYDKWMELKNEKHSVCKDFGQKMFGLAIQLYNKKVVRNIDEKLYRCLIRREDTYTNVVSFFEIVEELIDIMKKIDEHKFGKILGNKHSKMSFEGYMWCLLPITYVTKKIDDKLLYLLTKWSIRNIHIKTMTFNNLVYSDEFIRISNELVTDVNLDYYTRIEDCLRGNKDTRIVESRDYKESMEVTVPNNNKAKCILMFLETVETTDSHILPSNYTIEHIIPRKEKDTLSGDLIDVIGNLTLYEGTNSDISKHQGNSSLGAKNYSEKRESYRNSNCKLTRQISEEYVSFTEQDIKKRNEELIDLISIHTEY
jgi:hypothetical protein